VARNIKKRLPPTVNIDDFGCTIAVNYGFNPLKKAILNH
jgi:hypothetical protein